MTVSQRLAAHVHGLRYDDLPPEVIDKVKELLAYHLSLAFAGHDSDVGRHGVELAYMLSNGAGDAPIFCQRRRANVLDAVFANSELIQGGIWEDFHNPTGMHLSVVLQPIAWVLGAVGHRSGREMITALVAAWDAACALAEPAPLTPNYSRRVQNPFAVFGGAAATARLLGFDEQRTAAAIAQAGHAGMGVVEGTELGRSMTNGLLARNGVLSALVARVDPTSPPRTIEGANGMYVAFFGTVPEGLDERLELLGRRFSILGSRAKQYPGSGIYITPVELTRKLVADGLRPEDVEHVVVTQPQSYKPRSTYFEAQFDRPDHLPGHNAGSVRFQLAIMLLDGTMDLKRYERVNEPDVVAMVEKMERRFEDGRAFGWARVEVTTRDGRTLRAEADDWPLPPAGRSGWLRQDGERLLGARNIERLEQLIENLESIDDVNLLIDCLIPDRAG